MKNGGAREKGELEPGSVPYAADVQIELVFRQLLDGFRLAACSRRLEAPARGVRLAQGMECLPTARARGEARVPRPVDPGVAPLISLLGRLFREIGVGARKGAVAGAPDVSGAAPECEIGEGDGPPGFWIRNDGNDREGSVC